MGFRGGRGIDDVLTVSRRIRKAIIGTKGEGRVVMTLHNIENSYPRVCRDALWWVLAHYGADERFTSVCRALREHTTVAVKVHGGVSSDYSPDRGLRDGCPSAPALFNVYRYAVKTVFRHRRARAAAAVGLTPGLP